MGNKIYNLLDIASIAPWSLVNIIGMVTNGSLNYRTDLVLKKT